MAFVKKSSSHSSHTMHKICKIGHYNKLVFVVARGTLLAVAHKGDEITYRVGALFGVSSTIFREPVARNVTAVTPCLLWVIDGYDFDSIAQIGESRYVVISGYKSVWAGRTLYAQKHSTFAQNHIHAHSHTHAHTVTPAHSLSLSLQSLTPHMQPNRLAWTCAKR